MISRWISPPKKAPARSSAMRQSGRRTSSRCRRWKSRRNPSKYSGPGCSNRFSRRSLEMSSGLSLSGGMASGGGSEFPEFFEVVLQLPVRVEEPGADGAFGDVQYLADLRVRHSLDVKHGYHGPMLVRQLHHRFVQSLLELLQVGLAHRVASGGRFDELLVVLDVGVNVIEAQLEMTAPLLQEVDRHVDPDGMDPGIETRFSPEALDGTVRLREDVLEEVVGVLVVGGHVVNETVKPGAVFAHQLVERRGVTRLGAGDEFVVNLPGILVHSKQIGSPQASQLFPQRGILLEGCRARVADGDEFHVADLQAERFLRDAQEAAGGIGEGHPQPSHPVSRRGEGPKELFHGGGAVRGGIDQRYLRPQEFFQRLPQERVVRAAEDEGVHVRLHYFFQVTADDLVGDGVLQPPFLDEGDEHGARLAGDVHAGVERVDGPLVRAALDGGPGADDADAPVARGGDGGPSAGDDDADDGDFQEFFQPRDRQGRGGVARDDDELGLFREQEGGYLDAVTLDGLRAFAPVRHARGVAYIEDVFRGEEIAQSGGDGQPADAGVEYADGPCPGGALCGGGRQLVDGVMTSGSVRLGASSSEGPTLSTRFLNSIERTPAICGVGRRRPTAAR